MKKENYKPNRKLKKVNQMINAKKVLIKIQSTNYNMKIEWEQLNNTLILVIERFISKED